jgi:hypothetical protein
LDQWAELHPYVTEWEELAAATLEPNPFYEPWMLLPAVEAFGRGREPRIVLVFAPNPLKKLGPPILCGLFPLELRRSYKGLPVRHYALWSHGYPLCTPLIRDDRARECLGAFLDWLGSNPDGCSAIEFGFVTADGPFNQAMVDCLNQRARLTFVSDYFTRALFRPRADAESYLGRALRGVHRKDLRRKERRLSERGPVQYVELDPAGNINGWTEEFLKVEASGWKGQEGSALAAGEASRNFFVTAARRAFSRRRLMMLALRVNGRPISMKVSVLARDGAFALKIGYDETYASFSPGMLVELENIRRLHARPGVEWMDSCAVAENFINRLWLDRRSVQTILVASGRGAGDLVVSLMPLLRWLNRRRPSVARRPARSEPLDD